MRNKIAVLREKAIDFMHSKWAADCLSNAELDIDTDNFERIAKVVLADLTVDKRPSKHPFMFRTGGQSGSGKTTQLMPCIQNFIDENGLDFVNISVRTFAKYHPKYNELLEEFGPGLIREKTNGFALMMLFRTLETLVKQKYNILLEVTILDESFEEYLYSLAKKNRFNVHFHVLSVPREKSDFWIEKRKNSSKTEGNRVVFKSSSDFFYGVLPTTLKKMIFYNFWSKNDRVILWNGFDFKPILVGKVYKNRKFIDLFEKYRGINDFEDADEAELLKSKINWFNEYYG